MAKLTLTQIARLLKSEWLLLILAIFSIGLFLTAIFALSQRKPQPIAKGTPWQDNIYVGETTKQKLESKLGTPLKIEEKEGKISYFYPSTNQYRPHQIELLNNTVSLIKEQVIGAERSTLDDHIQKYGQPEKILYGEHGTFAPGHFWGQNGLLVFAGQFDKTIVEIWYFAPTTLDDFLNKNPQLSTQEPQQF